MLPPWCHHCGQDLELYDTAQHHTCPRCGAHLPVEKELRHVPTAPL